MNKENKRICRPHPGPVPDLTEKPMETKIPRQTRKSRGTPPATDKTAAKENKHRPFALRETQKKMD